MNAVINVTLQRKYGNHNQNYELRGLYKHRNAETNQLIVGIIISTI